MNSTNRLLRLLHLPQHPQGLLEVGMEIGAHQIEDFNDDRIAKRVEHLIANLAVRDKLLGPQNRKLLRHIRLLHPKLLDQRSSGKLSISKKLQNGDPSGM